MAIGFGSNLGDRRGYLDAGLAALAAHARLVAVSSLYESAPVGPVDQDSFLNAVAVFDGDAEPAAVLERLLAVEQTQGRTRDVRWGPRTLDLDLLLFGDRAVEEPGLTVPHPELTRRRFVLEPLLEAWPGAALPDGTPLAGFLEAIRDQRVQRLGPWRAGWVRRLWSRFRRTVTGTE